LRQPAPHRAEPFFTSSPFEPTLDPITSWDQIDLTDMGAMITAIARGVRLLREQAGVLAEKGTRHRARGFWAVSTVRGLHRGAPRSELYSNSDTGVHGPARGHPLPAQQHGSA